MIPVHFSLIYPPPQPPHPPWVQDLLYMDEGDVAGLGLKPIPAKRFAQNLAELKVPSLRRLPPPSPTHSISPSLHAFPTHQSPPLPHTVAHTPPHTHTRFFFNHAASYICTSSPRMLWPEQKEARLRRRPRLSFPPGNLPLLIHPSAGHWPLRDLMRHKGGPGGVPS